MLWAITNYMKYKWWCYGLSILTRFFFHTAIPGVQPSQKDISLWSSVSPILPEPGQHQQESVCSALPQQKALPGGESCLKMKDFNPPTHFFKDSLCPRHWLPSPPKLLNMSSITTLHAAFRSFWSITATFGWSVFTAARQYKPCGGWIHALPGAIIKNKQTNIGSCFPACLSSLTGSPLPATCYRGCYTTIPGIILSVLLQVSFRYNLQVSTVFHCSGSTSPGLTATHWPGLTLWTLRTLRAVTDNVGLLNRPCV